MLLKSVMPSALSIVNKYNAPETTTVSSDYKLDSYVNQSVSFVKSKLESKAVNVQVIGNGNTVLEQYPEAGSKVAKNDRVFIKTESNDIVLPNFTGWSRKDVLTFGSLSGVNITIDGGNGLVGAQSAPEGTVVHNGDALTITLQ